MTHSRMLMIVLIAAVCIEGANVGAAAVITVDDSGGADFMSIQAAVAAAAAGDTIEVRSGTYHENVDVDKRITLIGEGADVVTVTAASSWGDAFYISNNLVNISGFTMTNATGGAGIHLSSANHCNISGNNVSGNRRGIYMWDSSNNTLANNTADSNSRHGIELVNSSYNTLSNNYAANSFSGNGIELDDSCNYNTLTSNTANSNNDNGICIHDSSSYNTLMSNTANSNNENGIELYDSCNYNTITSNTANSNNENGVELYDSCNYNTLTSNTANSNNEAGIRLRNSNNNIIFSINCSNNDDEGIDLSKSSNNSISNNTCLNNSNEGIDLDKSSNSNRISNNTCSNNGDGISFYKSNDNHVSDNICSNNDNGIDLYGSNNNRISNTICSNNGDGIELDSSSNNSLIENTVSWNDGCGICLDSSSNNTLTNNTVSENDYNFGVSGNTLSDYIQNIDTSNTVDGKPIYYWVGQRDKQIPGDAGFVGVVNSTNIMVSDLILTRNYEGVLFAYTDNSTIENVTASDNYHGIFLRSASENILASNTANSNNKYGIYLYHSSNNSLTGNMMSENDYNFGVYGNIHSHFIQKMDTSNLVDKKPVYYWVDQCDRKVPSDVGFVGIVNSTNITVKDSTLTNNSVGVMFAYTDNSRIENVTALGNNWQGIYLWYSSNNNLTENNVSKNDYYGIFLHHSSNNSLTCNMMSENDYNFGISGNILSHFIQNIDKSNLVDKKPVYYWVDQLDKEVPSDAGFVGIVNSTNITVKDSTLTNNIVGVMFAYTDKSRIENITASRNDDYGISLWHSINNSLIGNTVLLNDKYGIYLDNSNNNRLTENDVSWNEECGISMDSSVGNSLARNNVFRNEDYGIGMWYSIGNCLYENNVSENDGFGIGMDSSNNNNFTENIVSWNEEYGIRFDSSIGNSFTKNNVFRNDNGGISMNRSSNNIICGNTVSLNDNYGICLEDSINNSITENTVSRNEDRGICLDRSISNSLYHNSFIDNNEQAHAAADTNQWDNGYPSGGNYWSDYEEKYPDAREIDESGIWDTPYDISGDAGAKDKYPLMEPWTGATDTTPPMLTITLPAPNTTTYMPTITITGTASDASDIALVTVNGALADGAADWSTWKAEVTLSEGENTITVIATDKTGVSTTKIVIVTYILLLDGKVLSSSTNDGIENVTVTLIGTGKTNKTCTNGYHSFFGVADGSYTLTASKPGYTFSPVDVVVSESTRASPIIGTIDTTVINAEITSTVMPSGSFRPGDSVEVNITVKNTGIIEHTFYVGYSVCDPEDTFWDAPYVPVTLSTNESTTETMSWTVQPGAPTGLYDVYTAAWATQHWSYLYDNLDRENSYEIFSVQTNPGSVPGWTFNNDRSYNVLVNGKGYTAIWASNDSNDNRSWMIYDTDGKVPDITTFQRAAKTATVVNMLGTDTTDEVESLRSIQDSMNYFIDLTVLSKFTLWVRNTGAYLLGKIVVMSASGGSSLTTEIPAKEALKVAKEEISKELSEKIKGDIEGIITGETSMKEVLAKTAIEKIEQSASELGIAANVLETHGEGLWTYDEANSYYDNYKSGAINGTTYINLSYELQPGSDFASQMFDACNEAIKGATSGIHEIDLAELITKVEDIKAIEYSAIVRKKYENTFADTDARFGIDAIKLWNAYQDTNKIGGTLMCPGSLHAYDSEGRHVGMNLTGGIDLEIPNSYYSGPDAEPEIIRIYIPQDDNITFYVDNATTTGTFNLTLEKQMNMTLESVAYLNIIINETTVFSVSTDNSSNPEYIMDIDYDGDGTTDNTTEPTHILINHAPIVSITTPAGDQSGNVTISYNLKDAENDNCTIIAQYSFDNNTWLDATIWEGDNGIVNIISTPAGLNHTFVWASGMDISNNNESVYFRIRPFDGNLAGDYATTIMIANKTDTTGNGTISIGSMTTDVNDTIKLPITIANTSNIQQITFNLIYDPDVVTIINITANDTIPSSTITYTLDSGNAAIELTNPNNITVTNTTPLIDIAFQAGENTGTTVLNLQNVELTNETRSHAPATIINGIIKVCIIGDFNNNNRVDIGDVAKVAFMVAGKVTPDPRADFNGNGRVDIGDAAKIAFYLAGKVNEL